MRTKLHGGNNLAFAEFEKIHPGLVRIRTSRFSTQQLTPTTGSFREELPSLAGQFYRLSIALLRHAMPGLTHLLPDIRTGHSEVTTSAFFGGAQFDKSAVTTNSTTPASNCLKSVTAKCVLYYSPHPVSTSFSNSLKT